MAKSLSFILVGVLLLDSMIISWVEKLSLIDYPGKVACVVFTPGCNLRCRFCHNPEFVLPEKIQQIKDSFTLEKDFFSFLEKRKWLLDGVSICGWEPTLQSGLTAFIRRVKSLWFSVKLDTNGCNPVLLKKLIDEGLVDYIAMDLKHTWESYASLVGGIENIARYQESVDVIRQYAHDYEFRTTIISPYHSLEDVQRISETILWAKRYYLQKFRSGNNLDIVFDGVPPEESLLEEMKKIALNHVVSCSIRR